MIMPKLIINTYVSLVYELKKMERYLRVNLLGPGPRLTKKRIYRAAVSQRLRNTGIVGIVTTPKLGPTLSIQGTESYLLWRKAARK